MMLIIQLIKMNDGDLWENESHCVVTWNEKQTN